MKLALNGIIKLVLGVVILAALIFLPAGSFAFLGGWLFLCLLFIPMLLLGAVLLVKAPKLLRKRLDIKEKQGAQKGVVAVSGVIFLVGFILAGLDFRFAWSNLPVYAVIIASVVFVLGYLIYAEVLRENEYLSRTVKVEEGQRVISTGLYSVVRHPMYLATVLMFLSVPIILGSLVSAVLFLCYPVVIAVRIVNEEKLLTEQLSGYSEYKQKVKYRLIPFIW